MQAKIALISIVTNNIAEMLSFYRDVLGFGVEINLDQYVEFKSEGVRFALGTPQVMRDATGHSSFTEPVSGQKFELAFPLDTPQAVDEAYAQIVAKGATPIKSPADMPWGQRTAFFADPDGNIHELFANLPQ